MSWRRFLRRGRQDDDRAAEMQSHVDLATEHYVAQGMSEDQARREARLRFGNSRAHRESVDDMNRLPILDMLGLDLRYALRMLSRTPAFTLTAIGTLAIVIGANAAVFSVADYVLIRPLPYPQPDRLAVAEVHRRASGSGDDGFGVDGFMFEAVRDHVTVANAATFVPGSAGVNFTIGDSPAFVRQQRVGAGFFGVLGAPPLIGREFSPDEDRPGGPNAVVLSYGLWQRALGGDPAVVGRPIVLRGESYRVVGVMPQDFRGTNDVDLWTPLRTSTTGEGANTNYEVLMRLHPDATWADLDRELRALSHPELFRSMGVLPGQTDQWLSASPMQDALVGEARMPLVLLSLAVGMVLLIACVNIASLLLARGGSRQKELATRMALGSGRRAVIRQLMTESLVIALAGGALGLLVGAAVLQALKALSGDIASEWAGAAIDSRVALWTMAMAIGTSVVFGLVPAWQASGIDVQRGLADGGSRSIAGGSRHWLRRALVVSQVALGVVLLVSAGLLIRTFASLNSLDAGFDLRNITTASISLMDARYESAPSINRLFTESLARLEATPGVISAAVTLELPYSRLLNFGMRFPESEDGRMVNMSYVTPGFTRTLGLRILAGRALEPADRDGAPLVVLVNEAFQRLYSPDQTPIGRRILVSGAEREIVGVINNTQQRQSFHAGGVVDGPITVLPAVFAPASQLPDAFFRLVHTWFWPVWSVRTDGPVDVSRAVRDAIASVDPQLPVAAVKSMAAVKAESLEIQRLMMTLVAAIAGAALLLSAMGLFGLIAQGVNERRREFGIRLALGATPDRTVRSVALSGVGLAAIGAMVGGLLSVFAGRLLTSFLWGVEPGDPLTYFGVMSFLVAIAALSSVIPSLRLLRLDPVKALRE